MSAIVSGPIAFEWQANASFENTIASESMRAVESGFPTVRKSPNVLGTQPRRSTAAWPYLIYPRPVALGEATLGVLCSAS